jgi:hypothetical protein
MEIAVNSTVQIDCKNSLYNGLVGPVWEIETKSRYAMVLLPEGTEKRIEGIASNVIRLQRTKSKVPMPPGDPQWFPLEWLGVIDRAPVEDTPDVKAPTPKKSRSRAQTKRKSPRRTGK